MKKSLVALAALAVAGVASAQSSVTLFGVVDASISHYEATSRYSNANPFALNLGSLKQSSTVLANSALNSSRLGFRGTEDLGGGLAAGFWLEAGVNNDEGTGTATGGGLQFNRRSTISLSGPFGEIRLGRDYTPTFNNDSVFDPFGTNGVGTSLFTNIGGSTAFGGGLTGGTATSNSNYVRASNAVQYFLPSNIGGFYGQFMYGLHEKVKYDPVTFPAGANGGLPALNQARTGRYVGGRVGYANGPLDVGVAYGQSTIGDNFFAGITNNLRQASLGASFDFGVAKLFGEVTEIRNVFKYDTPVVTQTTQLGAKLRGALVGVTVPVGPGLIRASYARMKADIDTDPFALYNREDPKADKFSLGYVHNLSKRTALYATVARIVNKNGFAASVGGAPAFTNTAAFGANTGLYTGYQARNSTGYDIGVRHSF